MDQILLNERDQMLFNESEKLVQHIRHRFD